MGDGGASRQSEDQSRNKEWSGGIHIAAFLFVLLVMAWVSINDQRDRGKDDLPDRVLPVVDLFQVGRNDPVAPGAGCLGGFATRQGWRADRAGRDACRFPVVDQMRGHGRGSCLAVTSVDNAGNTPARVRGSKVRIHRDHRVERRNRAAREPSTIAASATAGGGPPLGLFGVAPLDCASSGGRGRGGPRDFRGRDDSHRIDGPVPEDQPRGVHGRLAAVGRSSHRMIVRYW